MINASEHCCESVASGRNVKVGSLANKERIQRVWTYMSLLPAGEQLRADIVARIGVRLIDEVANLGSAQLQKMGAVVPLGAFDGTFPSLSFLLEFV